MFKFKLKIIHKWTNDYIKKAYDTGDLVFDFITIEEYTGGGKTLRNMEAKDFIYKYIDKDMEYLNKTLDYDTLKYISDLRKIYGKYAEAKWNSIIGTIISISTSVLMTLIEHAIS